MNKSAVEKLLIDLDREAKGSPEQKIHRIYELIAYEEQKSLEAELKGFVTVAKTIKAMETIVENTNINHPQLCELIARLLEEVAADIASQHSELMQALLKHVHRIRQMK